MSGKKAYPNSAATQTNIVMHVKGSNVNEAAEPSEVIEAANFVTYQTCDYQWANSAYPSVFFSIQFIEQKIPMIGVDVVPLVMGLVTGHMVLPYQIIHFSDGTNEKRLCFFDPMGSMHACDINDLYVGTTEIYDDMFVKYFQTFYHN